MSSELPRPRGALAVALLCGLLSACSYKEELPNADLKGTLRIPKDMLSLQLTDLENNTWTVDDIRALGPVYVGVYAGIDEDLFSYPHPEWGPVLNSDVGGDAYPYGGGTAGRLTWGCYAATVCRSVTGRYGSYEEVLQFFRDELRSPITDEAGREITSATEFQEKCFASDYVTSDDEIDLVDADNPLFEDKGDYFEAPIEILHAQFEPGVSVWGWVDMPSPAFGFSTCDDSQGAYQYNYDEQYYKGTNFTDVLNFPGKYIGDGDLISWEAAVIDDPEKDFVLELGYKHGN